MTVAVEQASVEAATYFASQMVAHIMRNLVFNGVLDPEGLIANIRETQQRGSSILGPEHKPHLGEFAQTFERAVRDADSQRRKGRR